MTVSIPDDATVQAILDADVQERGLKWLDKMIKILNEASGVG